jgi:hypothetical protein
MTGFRKLALVAAVTCLPAAGMAMQPLQDEEMSSVTGQDGISIQLDVDMSMDLGFEDTTGLGGYDLDGAGTTADNAGMIFMPGISVFGNDINIEIDAGARAGGSGAGSDAVLLVQIDVPQLTIGDDGDPVNNFELYIQGSGLGATDDERDANLALGRLAAVSANRGDAVLTLNSIQLTGMKMDLQLGDGAENLIQITEADALTIESTNMVLRDLSDNGGGAIIASELRIDQIELEGTTISVIDDVDGPALQISAPASPNMAVAITGFGFSDGNIPATNSNVMGNVLLGNVNMAGTTVTIRGR